SLLCRHCRRERRGVNGVDEHPTPADGADAAGDRPRGARADRPGRAGVVLDAQARRPPRCGPHDDLPPLRGPGSPVRRGGRRDVPRGGDRRPAVGGTLAGVPVRLRHGPARRAAGASERDPAVRRPAGPLAGRRRVGRAWPAQDGGRGPAELDRLAGRLVRQRVRDRPRDGDERGPHGVPPQPTPRTWLGRVQRARVAGRDQTARLPLRAGPARDHRRPAPGHTPSPPMTPAAIEAHALTKRFGAATAVTGLDLSAPAGSVLGLLGPNGSGKTTTVRMLATLLRPTSGTARILGLDVRTQADRVRRVIGLTGQFTAVDPNLTGRENLLFIARLLGSRRAEARRAARDLLDRFSLAEVSDRPVRTYSGGMRRRLDLAASLLGDPAVLFLDEPTTG